MTTNSVRIIHNITKEYPDMIKVVLYREPAVFMTRSGLTKRDNEEIDEERYLPSVSSLRRTKTLVQDLVLCNDFELFCTFTFSPNKIDRFNYNRCSHSMRVWLHHQKDRATLAGKDFRYLVVPEQHKSGAWHFHALISGYTGSLKDSKRRTSSGRVIYNITSFYSGFTTAVEVDDKQGVASYVTKYITKDFIKKFNKRRFLASRGLRRPIKTLNSSIFGDTPPLFRKKVGENLETEEYILEPLISSL